MSANKLSHLLETSQLQWSALVVSPDSGTRLVHEFPLMPEDFIRFSRLDLAAGGTRGYINSLSNAKRAMDCRVEGIISALGYSPSGLKGQLGSSVVKEIELSASGTALPFSYKFFESLGGFTPSLLDRVRLLRHDVEHRFQKPTKRKAQDALEIAELFVRSTEGLTADILESYSFGSELVKVEEGHGHELKREFYVSIDFSGEKSRATLQFWDRRAPKETEVPTTDVLPRHPSYYWLVRIAVALGRDLDVEHLIRKLVVSSAARVPVRSIKVTAYY